MKENPQGTELRPFSSAANERHSYKGRGRFLLASFSESQGLNHQPFSSIPNPWMPFTKLLKEPFLHSQNWVVATPTLPNKCALLCHLRPWKCLPLPPTSLFSRWGPSTERAGQLGAVGRPSVGRRPRWKGHTLLRSWQLCPWWPWAP